MTRKLAGYFFVAMLLVSIGAFAGEIRSGYRVLSPIRHGNLAIFPVVAGSTHDTSQFITLDEGLKSGEVVVTEAGRITPLIRRGPRPIPRGGAEVNRLVLVNNSDHPLLLLAGEIVTGGKQDRVIGKDRLIPAHSDPVDLSVFCVEPGRWTEMSTNFKTMGSQMAQPSVRNQAMAKKDQQAVWDSVAVAREGAAVGGAAPVAAELHATSSYARVMENKEVQKRVDEIAAPMQRDYQSLIRELRSRNAVGVVAAVNGRIIWADIFASTTLLEKYWPKLVRSYAAEAMVVRTTFAPEKEDQRAAQAFLDDLDGRRQTSEVEPGVFRHTEISGDGFKVFELTSLLPKTGYDLHIAKAAE
ncbi:MAG: ARPP-1 family domain-containing protein [Terriglobales bacterium]